jgi:hypothetical protein
MARVRVTVVSDAASVNRAELAAADGVCPECIAGKHSNCDGTALDERTDFIVTCGCPLCAVGPFAYPFGPF